MSGNDLFGKYSLIINSLVFLITNLSNEVFPLKQLFLFFSNSSLKTESQVSNVKLRNIQPWQPSCSIIRCSDERILRESSFLVPHCQCPLLPLAFPEELHQVKVSESERDSTAGHGGARLKSQHS